MTGPSPRFFDEKTFTGYDPRDGFVAKRVLLGHYNGAAMLHMVWPAPEDAEEDRQRKAVFAENWKNWRTCLDASKTKTEKTAFHYFLRKPDDFLGFLHHQIPPQAMKSYFESYQSYLWNRMLEKIIDSGVEEGYMRKLELPLFTGRTQMPDAFLIKVERDVLREEKIERETPGMTKYRKVKLAQGVRRAFD